VSSAALLGWALVRGTAAGAVCVFLGAFACTLQGSSGRRTRLIVWLLLVVPYLAPSLLVGYAYSNFSLSLVHHPALNELFYDVLLWMKLVLVAALVLYLGPSPLSREAVYCRGLLREREAGFRALCSYVMFLLRGPLRSYALAFGVVFLLAFGEFELASLFGVSTWSVALFDAHAGGLALSESVRRALFPLAFELALVVLMLVMLVGSRPGAAASRARTVSRPATKLLTWLYLVTAVLVVAVLPASIVLSGTAEGFRALVEHFVLAKDIWASVLFAGAAATCAYLAAGRVLSARRARLRLVLAGFLCLPGMLGPLVLSLVILFAFQTPGLEVLYDSPIPVILALFLVLLPFAVLLRMLLHLFRPAQGMFAARLLGASSSRAVRRWGRRLLWQLETRGRFWVAFLLFCWGYFDLTASSILSPPGMTPVSVRLYNLAHYGQSAVLSAMVWVMFCVPILLALCGAGVRACACRLKVHG